MEKEKDSYFMFKNIKLQVGFCKIQEFELLIFVTKIKEYR